MPKRNDPSHSLKRFAAILEEYELQYRSARGPAKKGPVVASLIDALSKGMQDKGLTPPPRNDLEDVRIQFVSLDQSPNKCDMCTEDKELVQ